MNNKKHNHRGKSSESLLDKKAILNELNITKGQSILDAGCGNGYMAKEFAKLTGEDGKVFALDPDETSIKILHNETKDTIVEAFTADITQKTKIPDLSIDLIYLSTVIHGFSEKQINSFLKEVNRILKPNGNLAILEIKKEETPFGPHMSIRFSPDDLINIINYTPVTTTNISQYFYLQIFEK